MGRGASLGRTSGGPPASGNKRENGVENEMKGKLIKTGAIALAIALFTACGSGDAPRSGTDTETGTPQGETRAAATARTPAPMPTRPKRIDHLLTPTALPEPAKKAEPDAKQTDGEPASTWSPKRATAGEAVTIANLIPEDPRTNDRVLLQDIYDQIDLEQFALDPDQQITWRNLESRRNHLQSLMPYPMVHQHPYLHLFPELEGMTREKQGDISYSPYDNRYDTHRFQDISLTQSGLIYFIYNPWFEPVFPGSQNSERELRDSYHITGLPSYKSSGAGPYWFGNNSVRGVLAETVAELLDEAKLPSAEPAQEVWFGKDEKGKTDLWMLEDRKWTMEEFISTAISYDERKVGEWCSPIGSGDRHRRQVAKCGIIKNLHITPQVEWEILHPQLPIVKITAHARQTLPLAPAGMEKFSQDDRFKEGKEAGQRSDMRTSYSVSFVMSLQNRWASFDDPNRWIIRFKDDLDLYRSPPWKLDPELPYPNYWDDTDYMQHRIIGPVVLTIHEYRKKDDVIPILKPGTYSRVPRIAHWEAPGHIGTDEQMLTITREHLAGNLRIENPKGPALRVWPDLEAPNAGFPLPGHVLTGPDQGPGTEAWRKRGMEGHDW